VTFHQQVAGVNLPSGGIIVSAASGGTLQIDAGSTDQQIDYTASTSTSGTIQVTDATNAAVGSDSYGAGITHVTIVTNNAGGTTVNAPYVAAATHLRINSGTGGGDAINLGGGEGLYVLDALVYLPGRTTRSRPPPTATKR
jgi:hypothetical protein